MDRGVDLVIPWSAALSVTAICAVFAVTATAVPILRKRAAT
jgi:hypothetical protein